MTEPRTSEPTTMVSPTLAQPQVVQHITITGDYYQVVYEQAAVKGILGFKVTAQGGNSAQVQTEAEAMLARALQKAPVPVPEPKEAKP